jgi:transcriptional regulator with XRE-family HTH domain
VALPCCDRRVRIPRAKYLPSRNRGIAVPKAPTTIGGHLRKRRLQLKILQSEAARLLEVSTVTLSRWERDMVYPTWPLQPRVVGYLGYDPFTNPELGMPKGNETHVVAFLASHEPNSIVVALRKRRLELRKNQKEFAKELGVSDKTLRGWELGRRSPCRNLRQRLVRVLGLP